MKSEEKPAVLYWDASAVLSALLKDNHSQEAHRWAIRPGYHFLSTLAYAEVSAVLRRISRERLLAEVLVKAAEESLESGPWRTWLGVPRQDDLRLLSARYALRGADLWHLAAAKSLREELPELKLLTFDQRLMTAAQGEGMVQDLSRIGN
jgi:predicted nucleic acid-binding protein